MKFSDVFLLLVTLVMSSVGEVEANGKIPCTSSSECTTKYCRYGVCTTWGENDGEQDREDPCNLTDCVRGFSCVIQSVNCFTTPCPGVSHCVQNN